MRWPVVAVTFAAAAASAVMHAQDPVVPSGRLMFRASSIEFRPDGTYEVHTVLEGIGEIRAAGTWKAQSGTIDLTDDKLIAGAELAAAMSPPDGCEAAGQYGFERSGTQLRLAVIRDTCVRRSMFLDKTRWAPPGEPNLAPPRTLTRARFDAGVRLPVPEDGSGSWPSFRGPYASGIGDGPFPERWNIKTGENILWRTAIPGLAHSSPIVWGSRLFVTSAISSRADATIKTGPYDGADASDDTSPQRWVVYALDAADGRILWEQTAYEGPPRDKRHVKSTYASATPATDGRVVVAWFGSQGVFAYTVEGTPLWSVDVDRLNVGAAESAEIEWGPASSPVIWNGLVFLQVDTRDDSFVVALSAETGEQAWKTERDEMPSWSTPTIVTTSDGAELVVNGSNFVRGYDPRTGQERWRVAAGSPLPMPTPVKAGELSIVTSGGLGSARPIVAVRHGARGELRRDSGAGTTSATSGLAWSLAGRGPGTPTPLAYQGVLYVLANNGVFDAYDVETGTQLFRARVPHIGSGFSASPVAADGKIFLLNEDGTIAVVAADRSFRHLATSEIDEPIMATPALSRGVMYVRGQKSIVAIGGER